MGLSNLELKDHVKDIVVQYHSVPHPRYAEPNPDHL